MGCASSHDVKASKPQRPQSQEKSQEIENPEFHDCYILGAKLGRGAFAQVRVASPVKRGNDAEPKAVKILDLREEEDPETTNKKLEEDANTEASVWLAASRHENIINLFDVFYDESCCYFVMEKCAGGLFQHLESAPELNERFVGSIVAQMLDALSHVHSVGIVHRDVKPDNFLMGGRDGLTLKLGDFGLSAYILEEKKLKGVYGTAPFMCPEMVKGKHYDEKADIWSVGVLTYVLLFGDFPYVPKKKSSKDMKQAIVEGKVPKFEPVSPCTGGMRSCSALQFTQKLLVRNPAHRPVAKEALQMQYLADVKENQHMPGETLPSLRTMLYAGKKAGAFEFRDLTKEGNLDVVLNAKQKAKRGKALPAVESSWQTKSSVKSNVWSTANSWNNAQSLSTTASATSNISSPPPSQMSSFSQVNSKASSKE